MLIIDEFQIYSTRTDLLKRHKVFGATFLRNKSQWIPNDF